MGDLEFNEYVLEIESLTEFWETRMQVRLFLTVNSNGKTIEDAITYIERNITENLTVTTGRLTWCGGEGR